MGVTWGDYNLLINPNHSDFAKVKIITAERFPFDTRIFRYNACQQSILASRAKYPRNISISKFY